MQSTTNSIDPALPLISVVVPSYNQRRFLADALDSIFRQEYPRLEVLVMDGGSQDGSRELIRSYESRLTWWRSASDGGQAAAINEGVERARGELVAWLNSDDTYWGDALWTVGRAWAAHPAYGLYIGNGLRYIESAKSYVPFSRRHVALRREALLRGLDYILQPATFFSREAWRRAAGLDPGLRFCLDWDLIQRIARDHPAVLINDFLAVNREHDATKTRSGGIERAIEILRMVRESSGDELTLGGLHYLVESVLESRLALGPELRSSLEAAMQEIARCFAGLYGSPDGFPERGDPQDRVYVPIASSSTPRRPRLEESRELPSISIVTPSFNQAPFLPATLDSILAQDYPKLETIVVDGGSTDGSIDVLRRYQDRLSYWSSEPDRGAAHAINKGLARAGGEVLGWINSDDVLAADALREVGRAFAEDPMLDMVLGNAVYIDEQDGVFVADHGAYRTGLYYGEMQAWTLAPAYWSYVHAVPQPTVFFRRRLLDSRGPLDESYQYIFDFELFYRFSRSARVRKIERTQAFYRIHPSSKTNAWNEFLVELYRFSRPLWPRVASREFARMLRGFLASYMERRYPARPRDLWFWAAAAIAGASALTRIGNPERLRIPLPQPRASHRAREVSGSALRTARASQDRGRTA